jgi:hypothetical protein
VLTWLKSQKQHAVHMILPMQHLLLMAIYKGALFMPRLRRAKELAWYTFGVLAQHRHECL